MGGGTNTSEKTLAILPSYYQLKDALVAGNAPMAAAKAGELVRNIGSAEEKTISKTSKTALLDHANKIVEAKDLNAQREHLQFFLLE